MRTPRTRISQLGASGLALALLAVTACSSASTSATVDGNVITRDDLSGVRATYEEEAAMPGDRVRDDLTGLIIEEALAGAAEENYGLTFSDEAIAERSANPPPRYADVFSALASDPAAGERLVASNARISLVRDGVVPELLLERYGSYETVLVEAPDLVVQACVRHLLTATAEEATAALVRIQEGEDFAAVAAEVSLDTSSPEGVLGGEACPLAVGQVGRDFATAVADAPLGEANGPVQTQFGFHIIQVEERTLPSVAELEADPMTYLDPSEVSGMFTPWFNEAVRAADIDVRSSVGTWSEAVVGISPPGP